MEPEPLFIHPSSFCIHPSRHSSCRCPARLDLARIDPGVFASLGTPATLLCPPLAAWSSLHPHHPSGPRRRSEVISLWYLPSFMKSRERDLLWTLSLASAGIPRSALPGAFPNSW